MKSLHNFECQICGRTIELPDGQRYAEGHHLQPLGRAHKGPDRMGNILCLCPNHHTELDYGVLRVNLSGIRHAKGHLVDPVYVEYHNEKIVKPKKG